MKPEISTLLEICFVLLAFVLFALIVWAVKVVRLKRGEEPASARKSTLKIGAVLIIWLMGLKQLSALHFLDNWTSMPPHFLVLIVPPLIGIFILFFSPRFNKFLESVPAHWLVYIQSFRIFMELILWTLFLEGVIGKQMTFEGRNFDVLVGITALPVGYLISSGKLKSRSGIIAWNIFGLIMLANIVAVAILSTPIPIRVFTEGPANTMIAYFPFVWLPGFVVPVAFAMHLFSIRKALQRN